MPRSSVLGNATTVEPRAEDRPSAAELSAGHAVTVLASADRRPRLTENLQSESERAIVREHRRSPESAAAISAAIREYFPESRIAEHDYVARADAMPGDAPDDRRHMAAAVVGRAQAIITWNQADFPAAPLAATGVRAR